MLSCAYDNEQRNTIEMELRDRYGQLPAEMLTFIEVLDFKFEMKNIGVYKADIYAEKLAAMRKLFVLPKIYYCL